MNIIKLNPSQELRLRNEFANDKGFDGASIPQPQGIQSAGVFATPLLCPIANLFREDFLSIKRFAIYKMQNAGGVHLFPCLLEMPQRTECAAFLCGISVQQPQGVDGVPNKKGVQCKSEFANDKGVEGAAGGTQNNEGFRFSLEDFLNKAGGVIAAAPQAFWSEENFFFNATSFKMCDMEINENSYKLYNEVWKKINEKD